jgi:DNA-binding XRE family transcriptional regulator
MKKLALKARVSESTLKKIIAGYTPAKLITRNRIAKVFNKTEEELFSRK